MKKNLICTGILLFLVISFSVVAVADSVISWPDNTISVDYSPTNIIVADDGTSYVTNNNKGIMKYLSDGTLDTSWGESGKAVGDIRPIFLAFDKDGDIITGNCDNYSGVLKVSAQSGESQIMIEGLRVAGIATDSNDNLYINSDTSLLKYNKELELVWEKDLSLTGEIGLTILPDGAIITTAETSGSVLKYTAEGNLDTSFGTNGILKLSNYRVGFASYDDELYVSCYDEGVIKRVSLDGKNVETVMTGTSPTILVAKNGFYFITNWLNNSIDCFRKPNIDLENDQFSYTITPKNLMPNADTAVTLEISSNCTAEYEVTAKVYNKENNELMTDITASTTTLADGNASLVLTPPASGWPAGVYYLEIVFTDKLGGITVSDSLRIADDITVKSKYNVSFDSNGGSAVPAAELPYGSLLLEPAPPHRDGYKFSGWYVDESLETTWNFASDTVLADINLYAKWEINTYTVRFADWNGTVLKTETVTHGSDATPPVDPTRNGYTFIGWNVQFSNITADLTVTAQYAKAACYAVSKSVPVQVEGLSNAVDVSDELATGKTVDIVLELDSYTEDNVPLNDKSAVTKLTAENRNLKFIYLDISLYKLLQGEEKVKLNETKEPISITITIPKEDRGGKNYRIIKVHNGVAKFLDALYNPANHTLTFETDQFSTYSLIYTAPSATPKNKQTTTQEKNEDTENDSNNKQEIEVGENNETADNTTPPTQKDPATEKEEQQPQSNFLLPLLAAVVIAGFIIWLLLNKRKKDINHTEIN